jgi:hypothetical protein
MRGQRAIEMPSQERRFEGMRHTIPDETAEIIPCSLDFFRRLVKHTLTGLESVSRTIHLSHGRRALRPLRCGRTGAIAIFNLVSRDR